MPEYNEHDEGGADFFPLCSSCGEAVYGEAGCVYCLALPRCDHDWVGCGPGNIWHECRLREGHADRHVCEWCGATSPAVAA